MLTPKQCRAARALLDWTQADLARHAGVGKGTIRNFENQTVETLPAMVGALRRALEGAGVELIDADNGGAGARLRRR